MVRLLAGSLNEPTFSYRLVSGSSRKICARSEFLTQTLPSASELVGLTKACCVASVCHSSGTFQTWKVCALLSICEDRASRWYWANRVK
jgi:hypothetical protein